MKFKDKHYARLLAVETIYSARFSPKNGKVSYENALRNIGEYVSALMPNVQDIEKYDADFVKKIVLGLEVESASIDSIISEFLKGEWSVNKLDELLKIILQLASYELIFLQDIPSKVILDEYVSIATYFHDDSKVGFVNGILDKVSSKVR
jgi:transcription antitermination protein NusB